MMKRKQSSGALAAVLAILAIFLLAAGLGGAVLFWRMATLESIRRAEMQARMMEMQARDARIQAEAAARLEQEQTLNQADPLASNDDESQ